MTGTQKQIDIALRHISRRFPDVDLSPINIPNNLSKENSPPQAPVLMPEIMQVMPDIEQVNITNSVPLVLTSASAGRVGGAFAYITALGIYLVSSERRLDLC